MQVPLFKIVRQIRLFALVCDVANDQLVTLFAEKVLVAKRECFFARRGAVNSYKQSCSRFTLFHLLI